MKGRLRSKLALEHGRLADALQERYHLRRRIGRGGMATVYLADDLRHERRVAVKVTDLLDRLEALFQEALDLPPAERDAFLDEHLGDEPEFRGELRTLLEHAAGDPGFLDRMAHRVVAPATVSRGWSMAQAWLRRELGEAWP